MIFPQCGWLLYLIDEVFSPYALHAKRVKYKVDTKVAQHSHPINEQLHSVNSQSKYIFFKIILLSETLLK